MFRRDTTAAAAALAAAISFLGGAATAQPAGVWSGIVALPVDAAPNLPTLEFLSSIELSADSPEGLSGVAWLGESGAFSRSRFAFVEDSGGKIHFADFAFDATTGIPTGCVFTASAVVRGAVDLEGIAFAPKSGQLWVSDENGPNIFRVESKDLVDAAGGSSREIKASREVLPPSLWKCRPNLALEALTFDRARDSLFTASEAALNGSAPGFSRVASIPVEQLNDTTVHANSGEWNYPLEETAGMALPMLPEPFTGLCGLAALDDSRLLALERTFGYEIALDENGESVQSLCRATISIISPDSPDGSDLQKRVLWQALTGDANIEGICLGPELPGGGRLLVAVSDGDVSKSGGMEMRWKKLLLFFRLRPLP